MSPFTTNPAYGTPLPLYVWSRICPRSYGGILEAERAHRLGDDAGGAAAAATTRALNAADYPERPPPLRRRIRTTT
ncbi:hypothetical protein GCM10010116_04050 [Microbispora rosea subsp. aerata]|nr:hypothetical protein GCM10010116_04050 [Microbispora rosea subsp. aerata]